MRDIRAISKLDMMSDNCPIHQYHYDLDVYIIKGTDLCYEVRDIENDNFIVFEVVDGEVEVFEHSYNIEK